MTIEEEIHKLVGWQPWLEVYLTPSDGVDYEITELVASCRTITFSIEQMPKVNVFTADSVTIEVKNHEELFNPDSPDSLFAQYGYTPSDGYRCPVKVKAGYTLEDGVRELMFLFQGVVKKIRLTSDHDRATINAIDLSEKLRNKEAHDFGAQHAGLGLAGGDHYTTTTSDITQNDRTIPVEATDGFLDFGVIQITSYSENIEQIEHVFVSDKDATNFEDCVRGYVSEDSYEHSSGAIVSPALRESQREAESTEFQFPYYPISKESISSLSSSDGDIEIVPSLRKVGQKSRLRGVIDYDSGVLQLEKEPTDPTSLTATWKSAYRSRRIDYLVKWLFYLAGYTTSELTAIEKAELQDWNNERNYSIWGGPSGEDSRYTFERTPRALKWNSSAEELWVGMADELIKFTEDSGFKVIANVTPSPQTIISLEDYDNAISGSHYIYGLYTDREQGDRGEIFRFDKETEAMESSWVINESTADGMGLVGSGEYDEEFDPDNTKTFLIYNDVLYWNYVGASHAGVRKIDLTDPANDSCATVFDITDVITYSESLKYNRNFTIYNDKIYYVTVEVDAGQEDNRTTVDYHNKVYEMNLDGTNRTEIFSEDYSAHHTPALFIGDVVACNGYLYFMQFWGLASLTETADGGLRALDISTGNIYNLRMWGKPALGARSLTVVDNTVYMITGFNAAIAGYDEEDKEPAGHLLRAYENNVTDDFGLIRYPAIGTSANLAWDENEQRLFFITKLCERHMSYRRQMDYFLTEWSEYFSCAIHEFNVNDMSIWQALSELALLINYEVGFDMFGEPFFRKKERMQGTLSTDISFADSTISIKEGTADFPVSGQLQIEQEVISYESKDADSFLSCTRGEEFSTSDSYTAGTAVYLVDEVFINRPGKENLVSVRKEPYWQGIYNVIRVSYGTRRAEITHEEAEPDLNYDLTSEALYGERILDCSNRFLTAENDAYAENLAERYYELYSPKQTFMEVTTKFIPTLSLGDYVVVHEPTRAGIEYVGGRIMQMSIDLENWQCTYHILGQPHTYVPPATAPPIPYPYA